MFQMNMLELLKRFFCEQLISKGLRPPRSPDLSPLGFFLWGYIKNPAYQNNPQAILELRTNIENNVRFIPPFMLKKVAHKATRHANIRHGALSG